MTRRLLAALALAAVITQVPHAQTSSWRPTVMGTQGMVAAGHPLAAEVGMRVLKAGGNAVDAAIAAWAIQGQVEPGMTGLGSDMFALIYLAKTKEVKFINGTGFAPQAATIDYYNSHGGMPDDSGLSIAVPGVGERRRAGPAEVRHQVDGRRASRPPSRSPRTATRSARGSRAGWTGRRASSANIPGPRRSGSATASPW